MSGNTLRVGDPYFHNIPLCCLLIIRTAPVSYSVTTPETPSTARQAVTPGKSRARNGVMIFLPRYQTNGQHCLLRHHRVSLEAGKAPE